jgi:hypothetical protein
LRVFEMPNSNLTDGERGTMATKAQREREEAERAERHARYLAEVDEVATRKYEIRGFLAWLQWIAEQPEGGNLRAYRVAQFYDRFVVQGQYPTQVESDLGLPHWPGWD